MLCLLCILMLSWVTNMHAIFYVQNCGHVVFNNNTSNLNTPFLIANNVESITLNGNTTNSSETPYIIDNCKTIKANKNIDKFNAYSMRRVTKNIPNFKPSQCSIFIRSVLYG